MRESPDSLMFAPGKKWNVAYKQYSCIVTQTFVCGSICFLIKLGGILRRMMDSLALQNRQQMAIKGGMNVHYLADKRQCSLLLNEA